MSEEMKEYTPVLYELEDKEGNKSSFQLIDDIEIDGEQYYALISYFGDDVEALFNNIGEIVFLKSAIDEAGEEFLCSIESEDKYERIGKIFMERLEDTPLVFIGDDECECGEHGCDCHLS